MFETKQKSFMAKVQAKGSSIKYFTVNFAILTPPLVTPLSRWPCPPPPLVTRDENFTECCTIFNNIKTKFRHPGNGKFWPFIILKTGLEITDSCKLYDFDWFYQFWMYFWLVLRVLNLYLFISFLKPTVTSRWGWPPPPPSGPNVFYGWPLTQNSWCHYW